MLDLEDGQAQGLPALEKTVAGDVAQVGEAGADSDGRRAAGEAALAREVGELVEQPPRGGGAVGEGLARDVVDEATREPRPVTL